MDYNRRMRERRAAAFRGAFVNEYDDEGNVSAVKQWINDKTKGRRCCLTGQRYGCMNPNVQDDRTVPPLSFTKDNQLVDAEFSSVNMGTYNYYGPSQPDEHKKV